MDGQNRRKEFGIQEIILETKSRLHLPARARLYRTSPRRCGMISQLGLWGYVPMGEPVVHAYYLEILIPSFPFSW